jgi:hypothetical protein
MLPEGARPILDPGRPAAPLSGDGGGPPVAARVRGWSRPLGAVFAFAAVVGFGSLMAYHYVQNLDGTVDPGAVPVVRADPRPVKVRPESPGGIEVPFRDSTVYENLGQQAAGARPPGAAPAAPRTAERILPGPETPLPRPTPPPAPVPAIPAAPEVAAPQNAVPIVPPSVASVPPAPQAPPGSVPGRTPTPAPATATAPQAAVAPPPPVTAGGGTRIQLASVRETEAAQREWARLARQHADVLGGLTPQFVSADLGERGVFVRLQAGPFAGAEAAQAACNVLRARGAGCNVVR